VIPGRKGHVLVLAAIAIAAIIFASFHVLPRDHVGHVSRSQALRLFDQRMAGRSESGVPGGPWPELGVYRYETRGWESIDVGLLSQAHDYDGESAVILSVGACGVAERWQVLEGRWSESEVCPGGDGGRTTTLHEYREFYGVAQEDSFSCEGQSTLAVAGRVPGDGLESACASAEASVVSEVEVVGATQLEIGGVRVDAVHVSGNSTARGENTGVARVEEWRRQVDGLLLRRTVQSSFSSDAHGGTDYDESYLITLDSLRPER
jgi:hypothetical protein